MPADQLKNAEAALRSRALAYPQAKEEFPWGHRAFKVKGKTFLFLSLDKTGRLGLSVKLPETGTIALLSTFARPTEYGLGKSGWVSASFGDEHEVPLDLLYDWIEESFRAIAPQKIIDQLDRGGLGAKKTADREHSAADRGRKIADGRNKTAGGGQKTAARRKKAAAGRKTTQEKASKKKRP